MVEIKPVSTETQFQQLGQLMTEYIAWDAQETANLGLDVKEFLDFYYGNDSESGLDDFSPPQGCLLIATLEDHPVGCIGFRRLEDKVCELKRLYIRPEYRGKHIGRHLGETLIEQARRSGYKIIRLETATFMLGAHKLYQRLGFKVCEPYYEIPESLRKFAFFMELSLSD